MRDYYMSRFSTDSLYTFEIFVILIIFGYLIYEGKKKQDWAMLKVYIIGGILNSITELLAESSGIRIIENPLFLGKIPIVFPIISFVLGFYEGGFFGLMAYYFTKWVYFKSEHAKKVFITINLIIFLIMFLNSARTWMLIKNGSIILKYTRRHMMAVGNIALTGAYGLGTVIYFIVRLWYIKGKRKDSPETIVTEDDKNDQYSIRKKITISLFFFWLGLYIFTFVMIFPLHIFGVRIIEVAVGTNNFIAANTFEQIWVMYIYSIPTEGTFYLLPAYIFIDLAGIIKKDAINTKQ